MLVDEDEEDKGVAVDAAAKAAKAKVRCNVQHRRCTAANHQYALCRFMLLTLF